MKKYLSIGFFFLACCFVFAQEDNVIVQKKIVTKKNNSKSNIPLDSIKNIYGGRYVDYKAITQSYDTIQVDTTLSIQKYFKHNFIQKDDFELLGFANQGQAYNSLGFNFVDDNLIPKIGVTAKQFGFYDVSDMLYYHVPTPTTILAYNSGFDGQFLNSTFATNFSKFSNLSIGYKGLRSIGDYQRARASQTNFRATYSYYNPDKRYQFRTHYINQTIDHLENGGLTDTSIDLFKEDNPEFSTRSRIDVNLYNSNSILKNQRFYYEQELRLLNSKDSLQQRLTNLKIGHSINVSQSEYTFTSEDSDYFTENSNIYGALENEITNDKTTFNTTENQLYLKFNSPWILGNFKVFTSLNNVKHIYKSSKVVDSNIIGKEKEEDYLSTGASWNGRFKGLFLNAIAQQIVSGGNLGSNLNVNAGFKIKKHTLVKAGLQLKTAAPNSNTTFFQSNFNNLNWDQNFDNEIYKTLYGNIKTKWFTANVFLHQIKNYTYYNENSVASQYSQTIDYLKLKLNNEVKFGKFALNNHILYQQVLQGDAVLRVPELVLRNTLYYQDYFFKGDPLQAQIGITFKYFTKYYANDFNPVLNEFYIQNQTKIGNYPTFEFFVNGEVRRTRIYFKVENFTSSFLDKNYFATRNQPIQDLTIRLGFVWNFWN